MRDEELITMSRHIASFFEPYSEAEAIEGVRTHLKNFWDPRMIKEIREIAKNRPDRLHPVVRKALSFEFDEPDGASKTDNR